MNRNIRNIFVIAVAICISFFINKPSEAIGYNVDENYQNINARKVREAAVTQQIFVGCPYIIVNGDSNVLIFDMNATNSSINLLSTNWKYKTKNVYSVSTGKKLQLLLYNIIQKPNLGEQFLIKLVFN